MMRLAALSLVLLACTGAGKPATFSLGAGYLVTAAPEDSLLLSPPPPAPGSAAEARDVETARAALAS